MDTDASLVGLLVDRLAARVSYILPCILHFTGPGQDSYPLLSSWSRAQLRQDYILVTWLTLYCIASASYRK